MTAPVRLQLSRRKGFGLQALSMATNGLPAVNVARPSKWGNPYKFGAAQDAAACVRHFRDYISTRSGLQIIDQLRGKNLACWCKPGTPCHADVLLEIANR